MDEDEDAEEKRRRIEAKIAAENFGAVIGLATGVVIVAKKSTTNMLHKRNRKNNHMGKRWVGYRNHVLTCPESYE